MADRTQTQVTAPRSAARTAAKSWVARGWWLVKLALALFTFVGALQLMKTGAASLDIFKSGGFLVKNAGTTLGLGWVGALFVLSGSPVAATALTLVAADSITEMQGFTMLTGSRLGAAFVVLVVAVMYAFRSGEGERFKPVSTAVMALLTTIVLYLPAALLGFFLLRAPGFASLNISFPGELADLLDVVYGGMLDRVGSWPAMVVFLGGLGVLLVSFKLIDAVIPELSEETLGERRTQWLTHKWTMFGLGCVVALVTMSVSVALTVLVPVVAKNYVKREDIIPYIMGANITTLGDTLLAAFALDSAAAVRIVLAGIITTSVLSVIVLAFFYPMLRAGIWRLQFQIWRSKPRLAGFTAALFLVPITLIVSSNLFA